MTAVLEEAAELCTFYVCDRLYGLPVASVREVIRAQSFTRVPLALPHIAGLTNVRGEIVVVIDTRVALGLAPLPLRGEETCLVVECGEVVACVLCDRISEVVSVAPQTWETTPMSVKEAERRLVPGAYKQEAGGLLLLLDLNQLVRLGQPASKLH